MQETEKKWFAVRTKPRQEEIATMHYMRQGFTVYSPKVQSIRRHARKTEQVMRPLFPGYIFLHLAPREKDWTAIGSTIGSIGPVRFNDNYPPVPDWVIAGIQTSRAQVHIRCEEKAQGGGGIDQAVQPAPQPAGQAVFSN